MQTVAVGSDLARLLFLRALLRDVGIDAVLFDEHISMVEGGIGAFPRRLAVPDASLLQARRVLAEAGEG